MTAKIRTGKGLLADAMRTLAVTIKEDGYELESAVGKAFYSAFGSRGKVEGIPEYFPISLSVNDESKATESKVDPTTGSQNLDERVGRLEAGLCAQGSAIASLSAKNSETNHICGNTIEQQTLSAVLANSLHNVSPDRVGDVAIQLAGAVKSAFNELNCSAGGFVKNQGGTALFGEKPCETVLPKPALNTGAKGDKKESSVLTLKLELDTSDALKSLDEFQSVISDLVDSAIRAALKPGGKVREAIKNNASNSITQLN